MLARDDGARAEAGRIEVAHVPRYAVGDPPRDIAVPHLSSYGVWTHSSYWHAAELASTVRAELGATR